MTCVQHTTIVSRGTRDDDRRRTTDIDMAQSDSRTPRKPYACSNKRKLARRSVRTLRGGRLSRPLSGGSKHMLSAGRTSVCVAIRNVSKRHKRVQERCFTHSDTNKDHLDIA